MKTGNIFDLLSSYNRDLYDYTRNGKCCGCGSCCGRILPVTVDEINTIRQYIKKHGIKKQVHTLNVLSQEQIDFVCPFLDNSKPNKKCTIYEVRPFICRDFLCARGRQPDARLHQGNRHAIDMNKLFED